jgi:hypothetical protein
MGTLEQLGRISSTVGFLRFFGIEPDPELIERAGKRILWLFAREADEIDRRSARLSDEERLRSYQDAFRRAYAVCANAGRPGGHGLFRVIDGGRT